jgi:EAL domain-containing protein (putative c-di-GMP-specific phosphodiesterase class I)
MPSKKMQAKSGTPAVLVVEATKFQRRSLCRLVRAAGADHVAEAVDLKDAERVLGKGRHPEWILVVDPDLIGTDAMSALKALTGRFPVAGTLLLTHRKGVFEELREQALQLELRIVSVLRKPVSAEEVGTLLRQFTLASNNALARLPALTKEELSEYLRAGSIRARFQPRIELESGRPVCCEAVACVTHAVHGTLPIARFVQAVTQLGAQRVMAASVLRDAAELVRQLRGKDLSTQVAVTLGPEVLSESSDAASLDAYVRTLGVTPADLNLEISPAAEGSAQVAIADNVARLKLRGYRLTLKEDAPSGVLNDPMYTHFSEIKLQPAAKASQPGSSAAHVDQVAAVLAAARKNGWMACAIGLQPGADLSELRSTGFTLGQGELIAGAMTLEETLAWVEREEQARSFAPPSMKHRTAADAVRQGA